MELVERKIHDEVERWFFKNKAIVIYGARQVGKTTLVKQLVKRRDEPSIYLNCDEPDIRESLTEKNSLELQLLIGKNKIVIIDEAQRVPSIGVTIKLLVDNYPEIQVIATGSSSLDLAAGIKEPLTGRKIEFTLYPLSVQEILSVEKPVDYMRLLPTRLIFGSYPGVIFSADRELLIREISEAYLYKDLVELQKVRNLDQLRKLLQALALQIGSEVSYNELGTMLNLDKETVGRYIQVLVQTQVIFELSPFKNNLRNTIGRLRKIYFCDLGIRNAIINNLNPLDLRTDTGALWENYCILERRKLNSNNMRFPNAYFWRSYDKSEIDYLEEMNGKLHAYEFKWRDSRPHPPKAFFDVYTDAPYHLVNRHNLFDFLT